MKRLLVLLAGVAAMMLVVATAFAGGARNGATAASTEYGTWGITLGASGMTLSGVVTAPTSNAYGVIEVYAEEGCHYANYLGNLYVADDSTHLGLGSFSISLNPDDWDPGVYSFMGWVVNPGGQGMDSSNCVTLNIGTGAAGVSTSPPPPPSGVFLCYSAFQTDPGVWPATIAASLLAQGYWSPYAVKGNVDGGTNVGGYHLVCNLATGQAAGQQFAGGDGFVSGVDVFKSLTGAPGWYPVVP